MSVDSVGGDVGDPQSWNRYAYAGGNPIVFADPDGRKKRAELLATGTSSDLLRHSAIRIYDDQRASYPDMVYSHGGKSSGISSMSRYLSGYNPAVDPTVAYPLALSEDAVTDLQVSMETTQPGVGWEAFGNNCAQYSFFNILGASPDSAITNLTGSGARDTGDFAMNVRFTNDAVTRLQRAGVAGSAEPRDSMRQGKDSTGPLTGANRLKALGLQQTERGIEPLN